MVNILLISTAGAHRSITRELKTLGRNESRVRISPSIGIYRLANYINKKNWGHTATVFDPQFYEGHLSPKITKRIKNGDYDIIGFSPVRAVYGADFKLMNKVNKIAPPNTIFMAGGSEASMNPEQLFRLVPWIDFGVYGYGEPVFNALQTKLFCLNSDSKKLKKEVRKKEILRNIPGIIFMENEKVRINYAVLSKEEFLRYSDYAGENIPYEDYWKHNSQAPDTIEPRATRLVFSGGCFKNCIFCGTHPFSKRYFGHFHYLSSKTIVSIILRNIHLFHPNLIIFNDENIFGYPSLIKALRIIIKMKKEGKISEELGFLGQTRLLDVDEKILRLAKKAGFRWIGFGWESGSKVTLDYFRKGYEAEEGNKRAELLIKLNSTPSNQSSAPLILGFNNILFPPEINKKEFLNNVYAILRLFKLAIEHHSQITIPNSLLIEAGNDFSPIDKLARQRNYPIQEIIFSVAGKRIKEPIYYLPQDEKFRHIFQGKTNRVKRAEAVLKRLSQNVLWPPQGLPPNCGLDVLINIIATLESLKLTNEEKHPIKEIENVFWDIIKNFCYPSIRNYLNNNLSLINAINNHILTSIASLKVDDKLLYDAVLYGFDKRPFIKGLIAYNLMMATFNKNTKIGKKEVLAISTFIELCSGLYRYHDDTVDKHIERGGKKTVRVFFDEGTSVLCGDWLFMKGFGEFLRVAEKNKKLQKLLPDCIDGLGEIAVGMHLMELRNTRSLDKIINSVEKCNGNANAISAALAVACVGGSKKQVDSARKFGYAVGMALALHEEIRDLFGAHGRERAHELKNGRITVVLGHSLNSGNTSIFNHLNNFDEKRIKSLYASLASTRSFSYVLNKIDSLTTEALQELRSLPASRYRDELITLCQGIFREAREIDTKKFEKRR